jgi:hypothetical protein
MTSSAPHPAVRNESKELSELRITINIMRDFLTLVELLDTLPNMTRVPYDVTRSLYQSVSKGRDIHTLGKQLEGFFGPPKKEPGKPLPKMLRFHPAIKYLDGIRDEQVLYMRKTKNGFFYGALWPWFKTPENITVHLGYIGNKMSGKDFDRLNKTVKTRLLNEKIFDELSAGEGGRIHGISLASFLQMGQLEKVSCLLEVKTAGGAGYLYLCNGELCDAKTGNLSGKPAAYEVISWDNTEIQLRDLGGKKKNEINQPLVQVLSEALRLRKNKKDKPGVSAAAAGLASRGPADDRYKALRDAQASRDRRLMPVVLGTLLALLVIGVGAVFGVRFVKSWRLESEYREVLAEIEEVEGVEEKTLLLQEFADSHPYSGQANDAQSRIREINAAIEDREYQRVLQQVAQLPIDENYESIASEIYNHYLVQYPESEHYNTIQVKLSEISDVIDDVDFQQVQKAAEMDYDNRIAAYLDYLVKHPNGRHKSKVESFVAEMSEEYYAHLLKEVPRCDRQEKWDRCLLLCDNFLRYFENHHRSYEIDELKAVLQDKKEVATLMTTVKQLGDRFEVAKKVLTDYLEENPDSSQTAKVKETLSKVRRNIAMNNEWEQALAYSQDSRYPYQDRIAHLTRYVRQNPSGPYTGEAKQVLVQLKQENRIRYNQLIQAEQAQQAAELAMKKQRLEAERKKLVSQMRAAGGRYAVNGSDTFVDTRTGLTWCLLDSAVVSDRCYTYDDAVRYVKMLNTGGYTDWRLPYGNELAGLYKSEPYFPGDSAPWYWTAEVFVKGYSKQAMAVTTVRELGHPRLKKELDQCGAVRAVRP